jgi:hypothetical protein
MSRSSAYLRGYLSPAYEATATRPAPARRVA